MANSKQYGLILPKRQQKATSKLGNVFGDDNASDEDDGGTDWVKKALKAEGEKNKMKKQTKLDIQRALNEDPTIYQYDEVYDDMERGGKNQLDIGKQKDKKSKYIQNLLKTADRRKKEQEHRIERMVQKEREAEGEMYADKESFVTSAYRIKLEEFKRMEEEEARMDRLEAIGDATKQRDMSGFYRHLYERTVLDYKGGEINEDGSEGAKEKTNSTSTVNGEQREDVTINETSPTDERLKAITKSKKSRQYRQRVIETYESDSEIETNKDSKEDETVVSPVNEDTDKSKVQEPEEKKQKLGKNHIDGDTVEHITDDTKDKEPNVKNEKIPEDGKKIAPECKQVEKTEGKISIWEKRTVGSTFEAALQRYYARKAKRLTAGN